jgi:competence protein ComEC
LDWTQATSSPSPGFSGGAGGAALRQAVGAARNAWAILLCNLASEGHRVGLWLVVALGTGIAVYFALPAEPSLWEPVVAFGVAALAWRIARRRDAVYAALFLALAAMALGCAAGRTRAIMAGSPVLSEPIRSASLEGRIVSIEPAPARDGRPLGPRVVLDRVVIDGVATPPERVRVRLRPSKGGEAAFAPGQRIGLRGSLMPPPAPAAPGAYDFGRQAFFQGIGAVGFAFGAARVLDAPAPDEGWLARATLWIKQLHTALDRRIREALPGPSGAMASALLTGEHGAIPQDVNDAMRDSGLAHLLAISGMNLSLVIGFLFVGTRIVLAAIPPVALRWPIKKLAVVPAWSGGLFYLLVTDATVPTQRAFVMATFVLMAVVLDRTAISMRLVALAAAFVMLMAPESLLGPSFQMSFAAVVALIAAYEALGARFARWTSDGGALRRIAFYLGSVLGATTIAGVATAPFAIYHFNRFALLSVPANMMAEPLTSLWIMPWGTLAYLLMPLGAEWIALVPMGWGLDGMAWIARMIAALPGAVSVVPTMPTWGLIAGALGGLWIAFWTGRWRWWGAAGLAVAFLSVAVERLPDMLIAPDGGLVGVRGESGLALVGAKRSFIADTWARRLGEEGADQVIGKDVPGDLSCEGKDCVLRLKGLTIAFPKSYPALFQACRYANAVVTPLRLGRTRCPASVVIGREDLRAKGAFALWVSPEGLRALSVRDIQGERPWSVGRGSVGSGRWVSPQGAPGFSTDDPRQGRR